MNALENLKWRYELLLNLAERQRACSDSAAVMQAAAQELGQHLRAERVSFFENESGLLRIHADWSGGNVSAPPGPLHRAELGPANIAELESGRHLAIEDVRSDARIGNPGFGESGRIALMIVPVVRDGIWRGGLMVNQSEPRLWTAYEIGLAREIAEHGWDALDRARTLAALRKSEERLTFALEAGGGVGAWDWDIPADRVYSNPEFARLFSVDPRVAASGAPISAFVESIHPQDRVRVADKIQRTITTGSEFAEEYRVVQEDGSVRWIFARGRCHLDAAGKANRFPGVAFEISDRKRAEEQLLEQWRTFDTALSNTPDFTYTFDLQGRFTYVNRALLALWQKPLSEAVGKNFFQLEYPPELAARLQRQIQLVVDTKERVRDQTPYTGPTGETRYYEYIFVPVLDINGEVEAVTGSTRDITERYRAEERERESQAQLRESARLESLGVMAGGVAHDFNNLLVGILGNASVLADSLTDKDRELAEDIVLAAERAADLTKQMLAYSGRGQFAVEVLDLNRMVRENLTLVRASISRTVSIELDLAEGDCCFVEADRAQIQQVIMNLLINASEAIGNAAGLISIRTRAGDRPGSGMSGRLHGKPTSGRVVVLEVTDDGSGMTEETQRRIFDPFFTTKFTGRGLGLAAVLGIVKGHHGDIEVTSKLHHGTSFRVILPAADPPDSGQSRQISAGDASKGLTVLLVDDERIVLRTVSGVLTRQGLRVIQAENGAEALVAAAAHPEIALVIIDLTMPVMTGDQAIPGIQRALPGVPIVLSSGYNEGELAQRFSSLGIAGFLQKPYKVETLIAKLTQVMGSRKVG